MNLIVINNYEDSICGKDIWKTTAIIYYFQEIPSYYIHYSMQQRTFICKLRLQNGASNVECFCLKKPHYSLQYFYV